MIGRTISHYKIVDTIGEGGMGVVYRAEDLTLKRTVALKFLSHQSLADNEQEARFLLEAQAAAGLDHPNICTVYEVGEAHGEAFIAMAYLDGRSLQDQIAAGPLEVDEVLDVAHQVARGLQAAHRKQVVHRDIKPANVIITTDGFAKIVDFGLAQLDGEGRLTKEGTTIGTTAYMSPEQAMGGPLDHRTDIWSLGVLIHEMVTGQTPFRGHYGDAIVYSIVNEEPQAMSELRSEAPSALQQVVSRALAKNPHERYQQMDEMLGALQALRGRSASGSADTPPLKEQRVEHNWKLVLGGVALLLVLLTASVLFVSTGHQEAIDSIAVLPLQNLSNDPDQDYFVDGMHEALIAELAQIRALTVISRTSMNRYRDTEKSIPEIAAELNVDAVVEGSVLRVGDGVRITAQLIGTEPERNLWAQSYDRGLRDVLSLHSEVARAVANEIQVAVTPEEEVRLASSRPVDPAVYELYLRGRHLCGRVEEGYRGVDQFKQAIKLDPSYAPSYAGLASCYSNLALLAYLSPADAFPAAEAALSKALELDDSLGEAHASLGYMKLLFKWDWSGAKRDLQRGLELEPNNVSILLDYGRYLTVTNQNDEARKAYDRAMELDPLSPGTALWRAWGASFITRRYDESIMQLERILELDPQATYAEQWIAMNYVKKGMHAEAFAKAKRVEAIIPESEDPNFLSVLGWIYGAVGQRDDALRIVEQLQGLAPRRWVDPFFVGAVYVGMGDKDNAFLWLRKAYEERSPSLVLYINHPGADSIRSDPRFGQLMKDMGIAE